VRALDAWLVEHDNRARPARVMAAFQALGGTTVDAAVGSPAWRPERERVYDSLIAAIVAPLEPSIGSDLTRLLLVFGLVESLAISPSPLKTADDVEDALRNRTVLIPKGILTLVPRRARLARRYGFADLYVVRDEWSKYEAGEIAHIENVLPHESKIRHLNTLAETEASTTTETETVDIEEHDSQTTDRMEVQQHGQSETDMAVHVEAQVEVEASYGPMHIAASAGGGFDYSQKTAEEHAYQQSHEFVSRSVKRVEERVKIARSSRSLQRTVERNKHELTNLEDERVVGIYRWVDKIQRMQLFRYPHRLLLEFQIPEPAAFLTWRRKLPRGDFLTPDPVPLVRRGADLAPVTDGDGNTYPLGPSDISEANYKWWVAQYNVAGVSPPPFSRIQVEALLELKESVADEAGAGGAPAGGGETNAIDTLVDKTFFDLVGPGGEQGSPPEVTIPTGYRLESWSAHGYAADVIVPVAGIGLLFFKPAASVLVGQMNRNLVASDPLDIATLLESVTTVTPGGLISTPAALPAGGPTIQAWRLQGNVPRGSYPAAEPITGSILVTGRVTAVKTCRVHVTLNCAITDAMTRWQQQTYEQIAAAYWALKRQRADEANAQATGAGVEIKGDSPTRNKEVIVEELKRGVVEMLFGDNFQGRNAMRNGLPAGSPPQVDLDASTSYAPEIQFIEQAFEWENLTYVLYPYYWGKFERWPDLADITLADPEFARFLRSGSARVVVPARPKFENQVCMYVDLGVLWGGGPVPTVNDPDYLSIAAEIIAQQLPPEDGEKRRSWEVRLPTTLVWLDDDDSLPKTNLNPALDTPPGVVTP
jgi:hypothetical protein